MTSRKGLSSPHRLRSLTRTVSDGCSLKRCARSAEVLALQAEGRSVRAIAAELGISVGSVHGMMKAAA